MRNELQAGNIQHLEEQDLLFSRVVNTLILQGPRMVADANASPLVALLGGGIAGGTEAACTYPFEFAKTRAQLYGHGNTRNPFTALSNVVREEGWRSLYKGCSTMIVVRCILVTSQATVQGDYEEL